MTDTDTAVCDKPVTHKIPPIAHVYCGRCFETAKPPIALCGRPRPGNDNKRTRVPGADLCVVCEELGSSGDHFCRSCGQRIRGINRR